MPLTETVHNAMLDLLDEGGAQALAYISAHTGDPGANGANEVLGGVYARQALTWGAANTRSKAATGGPPVASIPIPGGGTTVTHYGFWSADTGGTFRGGRPLTQSEIFGGDGFLQFSSLTESITLV
jgi:hypothetical protein